MSWMRLTISESIRSTLSNFDVASEYWEHIRRRYSVKNGQRVQRIKTEIATCRQQGQSVEEYYGKLMHLWTSLAEFRQSKSCGCPIGIVMERERQEDKLHEFLTGIDEAIHGAVKSNLLSRDPLPSLDEAYSVLLQDEDSKKTYRIMDEKYENSAHAVRTGQYSTGSGNSGHSAGSGSSQQPYLTKEERMKQHCSSCGRNGHLASNCFCTLGYPEWWG